MKMIKSLKRAFIDLNIYKKLMLLYIFIILLPLIYISVYAYSRYNKTVENETHNSLTEVTLQLRNNISNNFKDMESIVNLISLDSDIVDILKNGKNLSNIESNDYDELWLYYRQSDEINSLLMSLMQIQQYCEDIGIYSVDDKKYHQSKLGLRFSDQTNKDFKEFDWYKAAIDNNGKRTFIGTRKQDQVENGSIVFSFAKLLKDSSGKNIAVILVDYDFKVLRDIVNTVNFDMDENIIIVNENNELVYSKSTQGIYQSFINQAIENIESEYVYDNENNKYFKTIATEGISNWKILTIVPDSKIKEKFNFLKISTLTISGSIFLLLSLITYIAIKTIYKPLKDLSDKMIVVSEGNLDVYSENENNSEVGRLAKSFNIMTHNIKNLLSKQKSDQIKIKETEIRALQSQINPHFLYNTLNAIKWMAIDIKAENIKETINSLIQLLKNTIGKKESLVTIENEILNIEHFIKIQNMRYLNKFTLIKDIMIDSEKYMVLKLLIQPIVENAIFHAYDEEYMDAKIVIRVLENDNKIEVIVEDFGKGFETSNDDYLFDNMRNRFNGIGMGNVHERIRLNYGDDYGLNVVSEKKKGTIVKIVLPIIKKEDTI